MRIRDTKHEIRRITGILAISLAILADPLRAAEFPSQGITSQSDRGMVVSVSRPASEIGREILNSNGNAVDAAVAVAFALAVTWPEAGNIGGGGFMLIHPGGDQTPVVIDYREKAPAAATVDMFSHGHGSEYRRVGVPGTARGLKLAHDKYGRLPWKSLIDPAVRLARDGFAINEELARSLNGVIDTSRENTELLRVFGKDGGRRKWQSGDRLVQSDLSVTLSVIADQGANAFYNGPLADQFIAEIARGSGLITRDDLASYEAKIREPVHGTFRGYDIYAPPPPSSGGIVLVQMLNTVENFDLRQEERWSARTLHLMIESMRRAYCDRARFLGDPDFTAIPDHLITKEYGTKIAQSISQTSATRSSVVGSDILVADESPNTTHFSVIDSEGMAVSNTYTLEESFGSRIVVSHGGYLLNNEMGDFNPRPGETNSQGRIGTKPNLVAPGKRMLSSMTPVIVTKDGRPHLIAGSPGGRTIINTLFCTLINALEYEMPPRDAVDAPRLHHAWMPDTINLEERIYESHESAVKQLRDMGHLFNSKPVRQGDVHAIFMDHTGLRLGVADKRRDGWAAGQ